MNAGRGLIKGEPVMFINWGKGQASQIIVGLAGSRKPFIAIDLPPNADGVYLSSMLKHIAVANGSAPHSTVNVYIFLYAYPNRVV